MKTVIFIFIGTLSVAGSANVRAKQLFLCGIGGVISHISFFVLEYMETDEGVSVFITSAVITLYAEIMARTVKTPATVFLYSAIVPILPGRGLFHTVMYLIQKNSEGFISQGIYTIIRSVAISLGIVTASSIYKLLNNIKILKIK